MKEEGKAKRLDKSRMPQTAKWFPSAFSSSLMGLVLTTSPSVAHTPVGAISNGESSSSGKAKEKMRGVSLQELIDASIIDPDTGVNFTMCGKTFTGRIISEIVKTHSYPVAYFQYDPSPKKGGTRILESKPTPYIKSVVATDSSIEYTPGRNWQALYLLDEKGARVENLKKLIVRYLAAEEKQNNVRRSLFDEKSPSSNPSNLRGAVRSRKTQCKGQTAAGLRCRRVVLWTKKYCHDHFASAPLSAVANSHSCASTPAPIPEPVHPSWILQLLSKPSPATAPRVLSARGLIIASAGTFGQKKLSPIMRQINKDCDYDPVARVPFLERGNF